MIFDSIEYKLYYITDDKHRPILVLLTDELSEISKIGKRLIKNSNIGLVELQSLMDIIYHPESIRRLCFYLFSKTDDSKQRSEISEWIRNQSRTVEIDGEPSANQKTFSITFNGDKDVQGTIFQ